MTQNPNTTLPKDPRVRVWVGILTQENTDAPTARVMHNTLGGNIIWTYSAEGSYNGTLVGAFTQYKTALLIGSVNNIDDRIVIQWINLDTINIQTPIDNRLYNTTVQIQVYE